MPKSRSFTVQSPRGSPMTNTFPGFTSRWAIPLRCASASASAAGSRRWSASGIVRMGRPRAFSSAITCSSDPPSSHSRTMYGMTSPDGPVSVPMSRACTIAALRAERSASRGALLHELLEQLGAVLLGEVAQRLEHLERHRALPDEVHRLVHSGEAAFAHDRLDRVLFRDRFAEKLKRVRGQGFLRGTSCSMVAERLRTGRVRGFACLTPVPPTAYLPRLPFQSGAARG